MFPYLIVCYKRPDKKNDGDAPTDLLKIPCGRLVQLLRSASRLGKFRERRRQPLGWTTWPIPNLLATTLQVYFLVHFSLVPEV